MSSLSLSDTGAGNLGDVMIRGNNYTAPDSRDQRASIQMMTCASSLSRPVSSSSPPCQ